MVLLSLAVQLSPGLAFQVEHSTIHEKTLMDEDRIHQQCNGFGCCRRVLFMELAIDY